MPVDTKHPEYLGVQDKWDKCEDCFNGLDAIHEAGEKYLPRLLDQSDDEYSRYLRRSPFFNGTNRAVNGMRGMILRKPPIIDVPNEIEQFLTNIDNSGNSLYTKIQQILTEVMLFGRYGLFIDMAVLDTTNTVFTQANVINNNARPMMIFYKARQIINWKETIVNNSAQLSLVVLEEETYVDTEDKFEHETVKIYRVLELFNGVYRVQVWKKVKDEKTGKIVDVLLSETIPLHNGKPFDFIPFIIGNAEDNTPCVKQPPLMDLADLNLFHYLFMAGLSNGSHFASVPTLCLFGYDDTNRVPIYVGSSKALCFADPASRAEYLEIKGPGLISLQNLVEKIERLMTVTGARMLEQPTKNVESAERASIHRTGEESLLSAISQSVSTAVEQALQWFSDWFGAVGDCKFILNKDFFPVPMSPNMLRELVSSWTTGGISTEDLFNSLQRGDVVSPDIPFSEWKMGERMVAAQQQTMEDVRNV